MTQWQQRRLSIADVVQWHNPVHGQCRTTAIIIVIAGPSATCRRRRAEIVAGGVDGTVRRFDVRMGLELGDDLGAPVTCVAVSHDGNCLLAACTDGALRLLDKQVLCPHALWTSSPLPPAPSLCRSAVGRPDTTHMP